MANKMIEQARNAVNRLTNMRGGQASEQEKQAAQHAIEAAKQDGSPEEQQQVQQLEQQLRNHNQLS
ncbi:DUF3813 family protein [Virgibacillus kekensis]|uniref:DUF3813 family protein n=1 Tax=Virgibacillus kekensis TaxID=202261 RepID=A0ABV9DMG9_9BACI